MTQLYKGNALSVDLAKNGIATLCFDHQKNSVNKFDRETVNDLEQAVEALTKSKAQSKIQGLKITSGKKTFVVGADITEFGEMFAQSEKDLIATLARINSIFSQVEDLPFPSVACINGIALGGGLEITLCADFRIMTPQAKVGLPETKLGIFPGFGGSVRLPRIVGVDIAAEWIAMGSTNGFEKALKEGVVDAVVEQDKLEEAAEHLLQQCIEGKIDHLAKRQEKLEPIKLPEIEQKMAFSTAAAVVFSKAGKHYPAPNKAIEVMQAHANLNRDEALKVEIEGFVEVARGSVAKCLIGIFLNDQMLKKQAEAYQANAQDVNQAAVLGAGIMGGGIAYQSAYKGTPIIMKDIRDDALDLGLNEANKLLGKQVKRGKIDIKKMGGILANIRPTLNYGDFSNVNIVVEAVVENPKIKAAVLSEVEGEVSENTILASNTSTISITQLSKSLKRPENFVGMHFFNPVHKMPLVEVIRGEKSSDAAIATTVAYANAMGKKPIVVNDCPGFLVNRVLFPYFAGFNLLMRDGADFVAVDKVMESFGWPMGPAYLLDVVGLDTASHAAEVMAEGFPDRMGITYETAATLMYKNERLGQKNDVGFYRYELDRKGRPKKTPDEETYKLLKGKVEPQKEFDKQDITLRMMLPFITETIRCLEDNIVATAQEADMAMIYGLGFPPFRGGPLKHVDEVGAAKVVALCEKYEHLGELYKAPELLKKVAADKTTFYALTSVEK